MKTRCFGNGKPFYEEYHDKEWGIPVHDDRQLFELLILEGTQAGLSWELILKRRPYYRQAFHNFDPKKVALMSDDELSALMQNPDLIRNQRKIFAARTNALVFLSIQKEWGSFDRYLWKFVDGKQIVNHFEHIKELPCWSPLSDRIAKDLKKRGMTFVGTKIIYSFLQAVGVIDDHLTSCPYKGTLVVTV